MRDYEEKSYYEIQLDNKQLILVFLAGVTVCVLIFILGVMVGKGKKDTEMVLAGKSDTPPASKTTQADLRTPKEPAVSTDTDVAEKRPKTEKKDKVPKEEKTIANNAQAKKNEEYSFYDLDKPDSSKSELNQKNSPDKAAVEPVQESAKSPPVEAPAVDTTTADNHLFTVQVMATASKPKADEQLGALKSKGYTAFITEDKAGSSNVYKVRVGKFKDSDAAKKLAAKLKEDLKLETWVAVLD